MYTVKGKGVKSDKKPYRLPYGLRNPYRNLKSEKSQDYAQKPQRNCTFMNLASGDGRRQQDGCDCGRQSSPACQGGETQTLILFFTKKQKKLLMFSFSERKHKCLTIVQPKELSEKLLNDGNNK
jgi:hypothetical protein